MTHGTLFHTKSTKGEDLKVCAKAIYVRGNAKNENVRSETASDFHCQIGYKTTTNDRILMK